jgi:hypothetical protein
MTTTLTPRQRETYAEEMLAAVRTLQVRYPGRVPGETIATLAEDLIGDGEEPMDVRSAVVHLARAQQHYSEAEFRKYLGEARERRRNAAQVARPQLVATNERSPADTRAGKLVGILIAKALMRDPTGFVGVPEAQLTARQNRLREAMVRAIGEEPSITDEALLARFGRAG